MNYYKGLIFKIVVYALLIILGFIYLSFAVYACDKP